MHARVVRDICLTLWLCRCSQNEEAEDVMRKIENEEKDLAYDDPDRKLCARLLTGY